MWIRGSGSGSTIMERWIRGSGSTFTKCGSKDPDPDPHQNEMDPKRCFDQCLFWSFAAFPYCQCVYTELRARSARWQVDHRRQNWQSSENNSQHFEEIAQYLINTLYRPRASFFISLFMIHIFSGFRIRFFSDLGMSKKNNIYLCRISSSEIVLKLNPKKRRQDLRPAYFRPAHTAKV